MDKLKSKMRILPLDYDQALQGFSVQDGIVFACNGPGFKNMLWAGKQWLEAHINVVNGLNVFPVPDGDTGTNMCLTMQSALEEIEQSGDHAVGVIAAAAAHGALMGARGNSGVILSEFLQGLALGLKGKESFTVEDFADAAGLGVERAYQSVVNPVEGTILTVARAAAEAARQSVETTQDLIVLLSNMVEAATIAQANTPELLPVLKEAGVTDSGGQGLLYILEGGLRLVNNEPVDLDPAGEIIPTLQSTLGVEDADYGYDVQFLIQGEGLNVEEIRAHIDTIGESTVVVGDERTVKVHVHIDNPGLPLSYGAGLGLIKDVAVENMGQQAKAFVFEYAVPSPHAKLAGGEVAAIATVSVVPGRGLNDIFQSLGIDQVVAGGQTMNPSARELLNIVEQIKVDDVLILPNNSNIILTARQVQKLSKKRVEVVPTKTIPQGIAALLSFNAKTDLKANARRMFDAAKQVFTIEVTEAVRRSTPNGFHIEVGDIIGFLDNELVGVGQCYNEVALDILSRMETDALEIITVYFGRDSSLGQAKALAAKVNRLYPEIEVEIYEGGQPHYHYIISLE